MYRKIKYLIDHKACLGCGLCVVKGKMVLSKDGFYHPSKDSIIDPKIKSYCPGYKIIQKKKKRRKLLPQNVQRVNIDRPLKRLAQTGPIPSTPVLILEVKNIVLRSLISFK